MKNNRSVNQWNLRTSIVFISVVCILFFGGYYIFQPLLNLTPVKSGVVLLIAIGYAFIRWGIVDGSRVIFGFVARYIVKKLPFRDVFIVLPFQEYFTGISTAVLDTVLVIMCYIALKFSERFNIELPLNAFIKLFFVFGLPEILDCFFISFIDHCNSTFNSDMIDNGDHKKI